MFEGDSLKTIPFFVEDHTYGEASKARAVSMLAETPRNKQK